MNDPPPLVAWAIAGISIFIALPPAIGLAIATLSGDTARIAEIGASMIEGAVYSSIAAAFGLSFLGGLGALVVKAVASN